MVSARRPHPRVAALALAAVSAALVSAYPVTAASAVQAPPTPTVSAGPNVSAGPGYTAGAPNTAAGRLARRTVSHASSATGGPRAAVPAAVPADPVPLATACPVGMKRAATIYADGFEKGSIPEPESSTGWTIGETDAAEGTKYATSTVDIGAVVDLNNPIALFPPIVTRPSGTVVLDFAIRGSYPENAAYVRVNGASGWIDPSAAWGQVTLDITKAVAGDAEIDLGFYNAPETTAAASVMDIDDINVYVCTPVIATNVRGDFTGDYVADVLAVDGDGNLSILPGRTTGTLGTPIRVGAGWGGMTWIGSPGDVTGDKRPDILARRSDGAMFLYAGRGMAFVSRAVQIGTGWGVMNTIVTPGDMTGDGRQEIVARTNDGRLHRYSFSTGGTSLSGRVQIGSGFAGFRSLTSSGDIDSNKRGDLLAVRSDNSLIAWPSTSTGTLSRAIIMGTGWGIFDTLVGVGDLNKNGVGELLARKPDGSAWTYAGTGRSGWSRAIAAGTGFDQYRLLG